MIDIGGIPKNKPGGTRVQAGGGGTPVQAGKEYNCPSSSYPRLRYCWERTWNQRPGNELGTEVPTFGFGR